MGFLETLGSGLASGAAQTVTNGIGSLINGLIGRGLNQHLTGAQKEQNQFNAEQAEISRQFNLEQDSTKYQRSVADMQNAGLNPALAYGGVSSSASSNVSASGNVSLVGSSSSPANLQAFAGIQKLIKENELIDAQKRNVDADTNKKEAETVGLTTDNEYRDEFNRLRNEGLNYSNSLTTLEIENVYRQKYKIEAEIDKLIAETKTESTKQNLNVASTALQSISVDKIASLLPYERALISAQTESNKQSAAKMYADAMYQTMYNNSDILQSLANQYHLTNEEIKQRVIQIWSENAINGFTENSSIEGQKMYDDEVSKKLFTSGLFLGRLVRGIGHFSTSSTSSTTNVKYHLKD